MGGLQRVHEPFEAASHAVGMGLAVAGLVYLLVQAEGTLQVAAYAVYGVSLVVLYLASTLYHGLPLDPEGRSVLRRLDHSAIFLLIAGTATPPLLLVFPPGWGWIAFAVVWGIAAVGIVLRVTLEAPPRRVLAAVYLGMSWLVLVAVKPLLDAFSLEALAWLLAGGIAYTVGAAIYVAERPDPWPDVVGYHGVWHVLVLTGSALHYVFIAGYVPGS